MLIAIDMPKGKALSLQRLVRPSPQIAELILRKMVRKNLLKGLRTGDDER